MDLSMDEDLFTIEVGKKSRQGPMNKRKGSRVERYYSNFFKQFHELLKYCKTTRNTSKLLDNCKVDLNFLPILVQIKAGEQKGLNIANVLVDMKEALRKNIPQNYPEHRMPKIVIHHKDIQKGKRTRNPEDTLVTMTFDDFLIFFLAFLNQTSNDNQTK